MSDDLEDRIRALEAELAALKAAFLEALADPPLTRADRDLMLAELMEALEQRAADSAPQSVTPKGPA